jgi:NAD(P)-dependent dehydrogenase (short-subunit alcohol dehydrogenase family)
MLINNAGTAAITPLLNSDVETMDDMIALNVTALTRLASPSFPISQAFGKLLPFFGNMFPHLRTTVCDKTRKLRRA